MGGFGDMFGRLLGGVWEVLEDVFGLRLGILRGFGGYLGMILNILLFLDVKNTTIQ